MEPRLSRVVVVLALCAGATGYEGRGSGVEGERTLAEREAGMAAAALAGENERLRGDVRGLQAEVDRLRTNLAQAVAELDVARARAGGIEPERPRGDGVLTAAEAAVADASPDLEMVVLDIGAAQGVRPGMVFAVVRGDRVVARVRAADVRAGVTGATVMEQSGKGDFPRKGDRAVIWREAAR